MSTVTQEEYEEAVAQALTILAESNSDVNTVLANGIVHANDNLTALHGRLIDTLPELAGNNLRNARNVVSPAGPISRGKRRNHSRPRST